jgi:hypothetical protein
MKNYETLTRHSLPRVSIAIQFVSRVLPPSVENACSNLEDSGLMSEIMKRTRTRRPLKSSDPCLRKPFDFLQLFLNDFEFAVTGDQFRISCFR